MNRVSMRLFRMQYRRLQSWRHARNRNERGSRAPTYVPRANLFMPRYLNKIAFICGTACGYIGAASNLSTSIPIDQMVNWTITFIDKNDARNEQRAEIVMIVWCLSRQTSIWRPMHGTPNTLQSDL